LLTVDIIGRAIFQQYDIMLSSVVLLSGILLSKLFFKYQKYDLGILFIVLVFYVIGFYHVVIIDNYKTCYFISMVVPIVSCLLLEQYYLKISTIISSTVLFILCNYISGLWLFENYFFLYGMIPSSFLIIQFYQKLERLTIEKNELIEQLKGKNEEFLLFSNMMSHDLKAPLRNIEGFSTLLQRKLPDLDQKQRELFSFITAGAQSMRNLINDLLEYSKYSIQDYTFKNVDLDKLFNNLLLSFDYDIKKDNIQINKTGLYTVYGHEESLYLVFQNLISNAIKFQPKDDSHKPLIEITQKVNGTKSIIAIKDNGIGFDKNNLEELFMPFQRFHSNSEYEGTGLGMSIVTKIIDKHKGNIEVESELGSGSTFKVALAKSK